LDFKFIMQMIENKFLLKLYQVFRWSLVVCFCHTFLFYPSISVNATPVISSISLDIGPLAGGTQVSIEGSGFTNAGWYDLPVSISNTTGNNLSNQKVLIRFNSQALILANKMKSDCGDIRVYDTDQVGLLGYWLESGCNSVDTLLWVSIPNLAPLGKNIFINYQGPSSSRLSLSNINNLFPILSDASNVIWFAGNRGLGNLNNGAAIQTWNSISSTVVASQLINGRMPTYIASSINNLPSVNFNGSTNSFGLQNANNLTSNITGGQSFLVIRPNTITNSSAWQRHLLEIANGNNASQIRFGSRLDTNLLSVGGRRLDNNGFQKIDRPSFNINETFLISGALNYSLGQSSIYKNSSLSGQNNNFQTPGLSSNTASQGQTLGSAPNQNQGHYSGLISEVLFFNKNLTSLEQDAINNYLNTKYRLFCSANCQTFSSDYLPQFVILPEQQKGTEAFINNNKCLNIVIISATELVCQTPPSTVSAVVDIELINPDGANFIKPNSFFYTDKKSLSFQIRTANDQSNTNLCDLGKALPTALSSCSYRLKIGSTFENGYLVFVQTSQGGLKSLNSSISSASNTGDNISQATAGVEKYGVNINPGSVTNGSVFLDSAFNFGSNSVLYDYPTNPKLLLSITGTNQPSQADTTNTALVTHNLNISGDTKAGQYTQQIIYTVVPRF
jgi:hypothetical protein